MDEGGRGGEECKGQFHDFSGHFVIRNAPKAVVTTCILCNSRVSGSKLKLGLLFPWSSTPPSPPQLAVSLIPSESEQEDDTQRHRKVYVFRGVITRDPALGPFWNFGRLG